MALSSILYPRSSSLMVSPAFPVHAHAALAAQPRREADGKQDRFGQRVQQDGQPGVSEAYNEQSASDERARDSRQNWPHWPRANPEEQDERREKHRGVQQ